MELERYDWLATFTVVAREGSFTAAARALGVSQSTVSRHIAALETAAGLPLVSRRGRTVALTEAGRALEPAARSADGAVHSFARALAALDPRASGWVRVGAPPEIAAGLLAPRLDVLLAAHPALHIELLASQRLDRLTAGEIDVALRPVAPTEAGLVRRRVGELRYRVYATRAAFARAAPRPMVGYSADLAALPEARLTEQLAVRGGVTARASSPTAVAAMCAAGIGEAVLPEGLAAQYPALVAGGDVVLRRALYVVTHREIARTARMRAVTAWLAQCAAGLDHPRSTTPRSPHAKPTR